MKLISFARWAVLLALGSAPQVWAFSVGTDSFAAAPVITATNEISNTTDLTSFTAESGEPIHTRGTTSGEKTAWWKWMAPESGYCTVDTRRTAVLTTGVLDTILGVYTGSSVDNLTVVAKNDDYNTTNLAPDGYYSSVTFYASAGQVYRFAVDAYGSSLVNANRHDVVLNVRLLALKPTVRDAVWSLDDTAEYTGSVTMAMTATGSLSGKLTVAGKAYPFKGNFDSRGYYQVALPPFPAKPGQFPLPPLTLLIDGAGEQGRLSLDNGRLYKSVLFPARKVYSAVSPNEIAGYYTYFCQSGSISGHATGSMKVAANGTVKGVGTAFDGTGFTFGTALHVGSSEPYSMMPVYTSLSSKKGYFLFTGQIQKGLITNVFSGSATYLRPEGNATAVYYPDGLLVYKASMVGCSYTKPAANTRVLGLQNDWLGDGKLSVLNSNSELDLGDVSEPFNLDTKNKFTFASLALKPTLKVNPATGQVTGSFMEPGQKKRTLKGMVVLADGNPVVVGVCSGTTRALRFSVVDP